MASDFKEQNAIDLEMMGEAFPKMLATCCAVALK
jgi:hypothetical protein